MEDIANIKHSFFGYDPEEVEYRIKLSGKEYEESMRTLTGKLFELNQEIEGLQGRIKEIEQELSKEEIINQQIIGALFTAHMQATREVYAAMKEGEQMGKRTREELLDRENENMKVKKTLDSLTMDMESIAMCYNKALEACRNG